MNPHRHPRKPGWVAFLATTLALATGLALLVSLAIASDGDSRKLQRQIGIVERMVDQMLVDSPNFLVSGPEPTSGFYLRGFGVVCTFDASLTTGGRFPGLPFVLEGWPGISIDDDGEIVILKERLKDLKRDLKEHAEDLEEEKEELEKEEEKVEKELQELKAKEDAAKGETKAIKKLKAEKGEKWVTPKESEAERIERGAKLYEKGRQELIDTLLDYGELLTMLGEDEQIAIVARLDEDNAYFRSRNLTQIQLTARMRDLRAFAAGRLSREEAAAKIVIEES